MTGMHRMNARYGIYTLMVIACITVIYIAAFEVFAQERAGPVENVVVYKENGRFAGWPTNNGIWSWGDEIAVRCLCRIICFEIKYVVIFGMKT